MARYLIVVDMQKDFIDGSLGTTEAVAIVGAVNQLVEAWEGPVIFTRDTHFVFLLCATLSIRVSCKQYHLF